MTLNYFTGGENVEICGREKSLCLHKVEHSFNTQLHQCNCLGNCENVHYEIFLSKEPKPYDLEISFSYRKKTMKVYIRDNSLVLSDYLASLGGLVGLIAGVSVISLIEFFYHIFFHFACNRRNNRVFWRVKRDTEVHEAANVLNQDHVLYQCSKYFFLFMKQSSIHGLIYTTDKAQKKIGRIFWIIVVLASSIACGFQIADILGHAELNPIEIQIDEKVWKKNEVIKCLFRMKIEKHSSLFRLNFLRSLFVRI